MGDFTGFTFGNWHSSDSTTGAVKILRVSNGDRYEEQLHPEIRDITAEVPGVNGNYYFGSNYGPKSFDIDIAFDSLTELQLRELKRTFGTKRIQELIFDEYPYKKYMAKIESPIELSYVCFDEPKKIIVGIEEGDERYGVKVANRITGTVTEEAGNALIDEAIVGDENTPVGETIEHTIVTAVERERIYPYEILEGTERIYKGEGKISFVCYYPFAKSIYKQLPTEEEESDWAISSGILTADAYATIDKFDDGTITVYNAGDLDTGFCLYLPAPISSVVINYEVNSINVASLILDSIEIKTGDIGILIDTNNSIVLGVSNFYFTQDGNGHYVTSGNLYNEYVQAGYFFKLQPNSLTDVSELQITGAQDAEIFYDYLYF